VKRGTHRVATDPEAACELDITGQRVADPPAAVADLGDQLVGDPPVARHPRAATLTAGAPA